MREIKIVYENKRALSYLRKRVEDVSSAITNTEKLEASIFAQLTDYLATGSSNFRRIKYLVDREIKRALNQYRTEKVVLISTLSSSDDFGESSEFDPQDVLANVEDAVVQKSSLHEKIAGLASDDREFFTLKAWSNGSNDAEISRSLADHFGGNSNSHRRFIQRFREKCQRKLVA